MSIDLVISYAPWILLYVVVILYIVDSLHTHKSEKRLENKENEELGIIAERENALNAIAALNVIILETLNFEEAIKKISSSLPQYLGYEIGVLALIDEKTGTLKRVGLSETTGGVAAVKALERPFSSIEVSLSETENYCIKAINEKKALHTNHLHDVVRPAISKENAEVIQKQMGTKTTLIFPIFSRSGKALGTYLISMSKDYDQLSEFEHQTINHFINSVRIALENATLYTSLEHATHQLEEANQKLIGLDKLKDEFVSLASHELRTPMTAVKSYLWMTLKGEAGSLNEKQTLYINRAYTSVERLIKLINDMLNISRIESGRITLEFDKVDLLRLTNEVIDEIAPRAEELGIKVSLNPPDKMPEVLADGDKIKEVLFNLIGNSLKFTERDGEIKISFSEKDGFVETKVADTGSGISAENITKLFKKFNMLPESYSKNKNASGSGLGLYISRSIIELHKGRMWVESEGLGKGSQFYFTLKVFRPEDSQIINSDDNRSKKLGIVHTALN